MEIVFLLSYQEGEVMNMGRNATKAADNPFYKARIHAATYDDRLYSREGASELLGISVSTLSDYELGLTKTVPPDMVVKMMDLYHAPELQNYYCRKLCPIGRDFPELKEETLDRSTIRALSVFERMEWARQTLLDIAEDGKIADNEWDDFERVLKLLEEIEQLSQQLRAYAMRTKFSGR
jgi:hypothetical protein